jgi:molybdate/tungstate transport system ATP-binding protein
MLDVTDLSKTYDGFAFGPVDLAVDEEVLSVLGPSGSGKTTLLALVAGLVDPDAGTVSLDGRPLAGQSLEERRTGLVFQDGALFPHLTARENVGYAATDPGRVADLAARLEIDDVLDRRPPALSGGERQRVALARTLAADPDALLLDEPLSSLDAPIRRRLREQLHDLFADLAIPVVYVTHDQRTATALGDRIAIFRDGTIEQLGAPSTVLERPASRFVAQFTGTENLLEATVVDGTPAGASETAVRIGDLRLRANGCEATGPSVTACVHPARVRLLGDGDADARSHGEGTAETRNVLAGTVDRWLNEGSEYRIRVTLEGGPITLTVAVRPSTVDRLAIDSGSTVSLAIPPDAIHLLSD